VSPRQLITIGLLTVVLVTGGLVVALLSARGTAARAISSSNPLKGSPEMVDRLSMFDAADEFDDGKLEHVRVEMNSPARVVLDDKRTNTYPRYGHWISPEVQTEFGFTELIPSWNVTCPPNTGVRFDVRTRDVRSGQWTPWLYVGQWGRNVGNRERVVTCKWGAVHVDNIVLDRPADAYQIRARLESFDLDTNVNPSVRRVSVSYSGRVRDAEMRERLTHPVGIVGEWRRDLAVPFFAQGTAPSNVKGSICSPTSTTMVMSYWGVTRPVTENALAIYDDERDIFGNWGRAVARAGELGFDAWITRMRNLEQVKAMVARGQPVIAAINFEHGQFPSSVLTDTNGHLIVIRGFTKDGDVICNDPASKDKGNGVVYNADELAQAWFANAGGVAYVIRGPAQPTTAPTTGPTTSPVAMLAMRR
jgi:hypothetical protein